jgi:hypothetical protein
MAKVKLYFQDLNEALQAEIRQELKNELKDEISESVNSLYGEQYTLEQYYQIEDEVIDDYINRNNTGSFYEI